MNKVAAYLNEHVTGEVITQDAAISAVERDGSMLLRRPEMVARPAHVNDIRKIMRFCSQLADKGHVLPVTVRGAGTDKSAGAVGTGIVIDLGYYMHHVMGIDPRQQLVHVQAGISYTAVQATLSTHKGLGLPSLSLTAEDGTIGGAIGSGTAGMLAGLYGTVGQAAQQAEVILSSGDVIQTGRISKRELGKKKGLATFEGEIYRQLDNLITDNAGLVARLTNCKFDTTGFAGISQVKRKDGSFDLTPLLVGAQGALGIIGEVILKAQFIRPELTIVAVAYETMSDAQAAADLALDMKASGVEIIDGRLCARAAAQGKKLSWAPEGCYKAGAVVLAMFDDFSERARATAAKKFIKRVSAMPSLALETIEAEIQDMPSTMHAVLGLAEHPAEPHSIVPGVFAGLWLPRVQLDNFLATLRTLEASYGLAIPVFIDVATGLMHLYPVFSAKKVSDRQKILKLSAELARVLPEHEGTFAGQGGEGRLKASFMWPALPHDERDLYQQIRQIFDPQGILADGVKQEVSVRDVAAELNAWCRMHD
ncbi:MAG: FAD-binding oxidoreductase [Candidatus Saccharibacteria bacterium]|nr:FAD-binding oxidoreductase [Candidatus Saccharibacteria bacterium]